METKFFGREPAKRPVCPFCGIPIERPKELNTHKPQEMPVGSCSCGAVYAYDTTGHNLGAAFIEALVFGCNMDWDLAWGLLPEEDYLEKLVENYDYETHLIIPGSFYGGRKISGVLYFIRMHQDIQEVTSQGVQKKLAGAAAVTSRSFQERTTQKTFTKTEVEEMVKAYQIDSLLKLAGQDKKTLRNLQRLLYSGDELLRLRAAETLGRVSAVIAQKDPGTVSRLLQVLITSLADTAASSWGAVDAIGEIIGNSPEVFAGYIPALDQFLEDKTVRPKIIRAFERIARARPDLLQKSTTRFISMLRDPDPAVRGHAARLLGNLGASAARNDLERLRNEEQEINLYENGRIEKKAVGQLAKEALAKILNQQPHLTR